LIGFPAFLNFSCLSTEVSQVWPLMEVPPPPFGRHLCGGPSTLWRSSFVSGFFRSNGSGKRFPRGVSILRKAFFRFPVPPGALGGVFPTLLLKVPPQGLWVLPFRIFFFDFFEALSEVSLPLRNKFFFFIETLGHLRGHAN